MSSASALATTGSFLDLEAGTDDFTAMADRIGVDGVIGAAALGAATGLLTAGAAAGVAVALTLGLLGAAATLAGSEAFTTGGFAAALFTGAALAAAGFTLALASIFTGLFTDCVTGLAAGLAAALTTAGLAMGLVAALAAGFGNGLADGFDEDGLLTATVFFFAAAALLAAGLLVCFCALAGFFVGIVLSPPSMRCGPLTLINWPIIHRRVTAYSRDFILAAPDFSDVARCTQAHESSARSRQFFIRRHGFPVHYRAFKFTPVE